MKFDGKEIGEMNELPRLVAATPVGKEVGVEIWREGKPLTVKLKVGELKDEPVAQTEEKTEVDLGMSVREITPEMARQLLLREPGGVVVSQVEPGSTADEAGVQRGDVIREINGKGIRSLADYRERIGRVKRGEILRLLIKRGERNLYLTIRVTQ